MAIAVIEADLQVAGLTGMTLKLHALDSDTVAVSGLALVAETNRPYVYRTTTTAGLTGRYEAYVLTSGGVRFASGFVYMTDDTSTHRIVDDPSVADPLGRLEGSGITGVTFPTNFSALGINASGHVSRVTTVDSVTAIATGGIVAASFAAGAIDAAAIATDAFGALELAAGAVNEIWTTQLTEAYSAVNDAPTPAQALMEIRQRLTDFTIIGTLVSVKKINGTEAYQLTLDSATVPTSSTRST